MAAELYIGLMSGTSLDGIDAALVQVGDGELQCLSSVCLPYPDSLRAAALALHAPGADDLHHASLLANRLAERYAEAVAQLLDTAGTEARHIKALGAHGQTVRHNPAAGYTLQRSEEHTSELQSRENLVCRLLLEKKKQNTSA